jgi:hypothetical protein
VDVRERLDAPLDCVLEPLGCINAALIASSIGSADVSLTGVARSGPLEDSDISVTPSDADDDASPRLCPSCRAILVNSAWTHVGRRWRPTLEYAPMVEIAHG